MDSPPTPSDALKAGLLAAGLAWAVYRRRLLSASGACAAAVIGAAMFACGWVPALLLLLFFFSSSLGAHWARAPRASELAIEQAAPRRAGQVLAVGMLPALGALAAAFTGEHRWLWGMAAALGFATSDTWSTDWGQTFPGRPRLLGFGRELVPGQSGGMTLRGTLAGGVGALLLAGAGTAALSGSPGQGFVLAAIAWGGSLLDSVLGASVQWRGECTTCGRMTERRHHCGTRARRQRGGLSNEGVNLVCSALCLGLGALASG